MKEEYIALVHYGIELLKNSLGLSDAIPPSGELVDFILSTSVSGGVKACVEQARTILPDNLNEPAGAPSQLTSVFCKIRYPYSEDMMRSHSLAMKRLQSNPYESEAESPRNLWDSFCLELKRIPVGGGTFDTFCSLMRKYGWYVSGSADYDAISVFEQFKAIAALTCCTLDSDAEELLLVAGDIPGIQTILFTITSEGAAKSLRGRSFYLQLLNDAIVRAILRELQLPSACVIYNAGGNFKLLTPLHCSQRLGEICEELNRRLLILHNGEISFAHACISIYADDVSEPSRFMEANLDLNDLLQKAKKQPFAGLAIKEYDELFGIRGVGRGDRCDVCHCETNVRLKDQKKLCVQCEGFETLARSLGKTSLNHFLTLAESKSPLSEIPCPNIEANKRFRWDKILEALG